MKPLSPHLEPLYFELLRLRPAQYYDILTGYLKYRELSADCSKSEFLKYCQAEEAKLIKELAEGNGGLDLLLAVAVDQYPQFESYTSFTVNSVKKLYQDKIEGKMPRKPKHSSKPKHSNFPKH